ncbi:MAG: hypothetical protein RI922_1750 [Bacteroidota bacterium]|jgi:hypothetical protein
MLKRKKLPQTEQKQFMLLEFGFNSSVSLWTSDEI